MALDFGLIGNDDLNSHKTMKSKMLGFLSVIAIAVRAADTNDFPSVTLGGQIHGVNRKER
jgi:hypothetical protein